MKDKTKSTTLDGNTAAAHVAYAFSEVAAIYPITPASPMGEHTDEWAAHNKKNAFGTTVKVVEMQSEAGAAGAVHGSLTAGALTTTFTASQGLILMLPNMFKIAGEMLPTVFHVASRSLAYQSLSIFGDHSDVMATRGTGFALIAAGSVQEVHDIAIISHLATLETRVPFLHFFDGFRTSHEIQKIELLDFDEIKSFINPRYIQEFRKIALNPENPMVKVGAQNPNVYFQGRERSNLYYKQTPDIVEKYMNEFSKKTGRSYNLFDYVGTEDADKIIISMGSSTETIEETIEYLTKQGEKVGAIKVRLYRPFSIDHLQQAIPKSVKKIAVLDRTKEAGSIGEPLYLDVVSALKENKELTIIGGRYGLSSKEFSPSMVKAVFDHLDNECFHDFTVGIDDDVSHKSIPIKEIINTEHEGTVRCKFWGLGSDGTVGANKNSIKIIGDNTDLHAQGHFVYDSKKSEGITISYLRFGKDKIQSTYIPTEFDFIAVHNPSYIAKYEILEGIKEKGTFLLNTSEPAEEVFKTLTESMQKIIINKKINFYTIDALKIAEEAGLQHRINTVMQTAFFKISNILPEDKALELIKNSVVKAYGKKGKDIVDMNINCIENSSAALTKVEPTLKGEECFIPHEKLPADASDFAKDVIKPIMDLKGDSIPVSKIPLDGKVPLSTTKLEKRCVATKLPHWNPEKCIQCNKCSFVCPHATIRAKQIDPKDLINAPKTFNTLLSKTKNKRELQFRIQVYVEDCVGCTNCSKVCPTKAIEMKDAIEERTPTEVENVKFFESLPDNVTEGFPEETVKGTQFKKPLFEFSGACAGCGETAYIKLLTQMYGDRLLMANATGCSSIYGGTFPTIPYCKNKKGQGPAWANSLFEDNAEYGLGMKLALDTNRNILKQALDELSEKATNINLKKTTKEFLEHWEETTDAQKEKINTFVKLLESSSSNEDKELITLVLSRKDYLLNKSVWIVGGDGWAYDIGFGGLDHVLASGENINVLVLDTEVYSNTGGQSSKATQMGAVAKFAAKGKPTAKKNLGLMMMSYGYVYVSSVNIGANSQAVVKAMAEAEKYDGPSLIIAYCPCISHGFNMQNSVMEAKKAVTSGYWPLYTYDPRNEKPLKWESKDPTTSYGDFIKGERRFSTLENQYPKYAKEVFKASEATAKKTFNHMKELAENQEIKKE